MPFEDSYFDNIICLGVIQYLGDLKSTKKTPFRIFKMFKNKGKIIVSTFGPQNTFIKRSKRISKNNYLFKGYEKIS